MLSGQDSIKSNTLISRSAQVSHSAAKNSLAGLFENAAEAFKRRNQNLSASYMPLENGFGTSVHLSPKMNVRLS